MTHDEARLAIAALLGATVLTQYPLHSIVRFDHGSNADHCKAILDAFDPDFTGAIFADNRLLIANTQPKETTS